MSLYTLSPIKNQTELMGAIEYVHSEAHKLSKILLGEYLPNSGNIAIFCHYKDEFDLLTTLRRELTNKNDNFNQKYFKLHAPIVIAEKDGIPGATYEYLYVRQHDPYRHQVGDIDFYQPVDQFNATKSQLIQNPVEGVRILDRTDVDLVELFHPDVDVLAYISSHSFKDGANS
jgi:hypothetical protein